MIGRKKEQAQLLDAFKSEYSEFVAVYGRRRIGKTFLTAEDDRVLISPDNVFEFLVG